MLTILLAISPFALLGIIVASWILKEELSTWWWRRNTKGGTKMTYDLPYDPESPMVKKFQRLANINQPRRYGDYRDRFNLANMTEDIWIPVRNQ